MSPPMLNQLPAICFQLSTSAVACRAGSPAAASDARPVATTEMNALQLHHVINATTAIRSPLIVIARYCGAKSSADAGRRGMTGRVLPSLGLLHEQPHDECHGRRQQAEEKHIAPRHFRAAGEIDALDLIGHDGGKKEPDRRSRVQERAGFDAAVFGNDLGNHGRTSRPLAADAERRDDAEEHERRHIRRERTRRRANRVHHHRQQQRASCARDDRRHGRTRCRRLPSPTSSSDVRIPVHCSVAARAAGEPSGIPSSTGTAFGAT